MSHDRVPTLLRPISEIISIIIPDDNMSSPYFMNTSVIRSGAPRTVIASLLVAILGVPTPLIPIAYAAEEHAILTTVVTVVGGTATPDDFAIMVNAQSGPLLAATTTPFGGETLLPIGTRYTVDVGHVPHYRIAQSDGCFGVIRTDAARTCTITSTFTQGEGASLAITVRMHEEHGGPNAVDDFIVHVNGASASERSFVASTADRIVEIRPGEAYQVALTSGQRYEAILSEGCGGVLAEADTRSCVVTLFDLPHYQDVVPSADLLPNGSFEIAQLDDTARPNAWMTGAVWGTNAAVYSYPVAVDGRVAVRVAYEAYSGDVLSGGDAKWHTAPVAVTPGHRYQYRGSYRANTPTTLIAEFWDANGAHLSYAGFISVPATETDVWGTVSASFVAPASARTMAVYHQLNSTGSLLFDDVSLREIALPSAFDRGFVTLAFDDGYLDQYVSARPILNDAGFKGTFYAITHNSGFGVVNPSFEIADIDRVGSPLGWTMSSSSDAASDTYTYPVSGLTGHAARYASSALAPEGGWMSDPVSLFSNQSHAFSHFYRSTGTSTVTIVVTDEHDVHRFMQADGGLVDTEVPYAVLPPSAEWAFYSTPGLWIPPGSTHASVRYGLAASGTIDIDDTNMGAYRDFMTPAQLLALESEQHEVGGHTQTHADLTLVSLSEATREVSIARQEFFLGGIRSVDSFAYPLGYQNQKIQDIVRASGFTSGRIATWGQNGMDADRYTLLSSLVMADTPMSEIERTIDEALADRAWLILTFHQILPASASSTTAYTTSPERFQEIVDYLALHHIPVRTAHDGVLAMNGGSSVPEVMLPVASTASASSGGGSAFSIYWGCADPLAINYNRLANTDDQSCAYASAASSSLLLATSTESRSGTTTLVYSEPLPFASGQVLGMSTTTFSFRSHLRRGSRGAEVRELQLHLQAGGQFRGPITGYFGNLTFAAVKGFQAKHKIDVVGVVGPKTRAVLNRSADSWVISSLSEGAAAASR